MVMGGTLVGIAVGISVAVPVGSISTTRTSISVVGISAAWTGGNVEGIDFDGIVSRYSRCKHHPATRAIIVANRTIPWGPDGFSFPGGWLINGVAVHIGGLS